MLPGPEFFQTRMGQQFYETTMPRIAKALENIALALQKRDDLMCISCDHIIIKDRKNPKYSRADSMAHELGNNRWLCGDCMDMIAEIAGV